MTTSDKVFESSFKVAELIAKNMNSQVIGEKLRRPACLAIIETILGKESKDIISNVPLSNNSVSYWINEMADDINDYVLEKIKNQKLFSLQIDERTYRTTKAQL